MSSLASSSLHLALPAVYRCKVSGGGGADGFESREKEEIHLHKHDHAAGGPASKQQAGQQHTHTGHVTLHSGCHQSTNIAKFGFPEA